MIVLVAILNIGLQSFDGQPETAAEIRQDLLELAGGEDPLTERLEHIESIMLTDYDSSKRMEAESSMRRLVGRTAEILQRISLGLTLIQSQARTNIRGVR